MNVDKIARLFSTQPGPASVAQQQKQDSSVSESESSQDSEAVTVSSGLTSNQGVQNSDDSDSRAAKVASLKTAVANGTYSPDSRQVASAFYQELFV